MAVIPNPADINQYRTDGQAPVRGVAAGQVAGAIGDAARQISSAVINEENRKSQYEFARAESSFLAERIRVADGYLQDEDYETIPQRHEEQLREKLGSIADGIRDPSVRTRFLERQDARIAESQSRITGLAHQKERDFKRGEVEQQLAELREVVINGGGVEAMDAAEALIESVTGTAPQDAFTNEQKGELLRAFQQDSAQAWVTSLPPDEQVEVLNSDLAEHLPSDVRATMLRQAEKVSRVGQAQSSVDGWRDQGFDRGEMMDQAAKIDDAQLREETERRIDYIISRDQQSKNEIQDEWFSNNYLPVRLGQIEDPTEIPEFEAMSPQQQEQLLSAAQSRLQAPKRSDPMVIDRLHQLHISGDTSRLRTFFMENASSLTASDFNTWSKTSLTEALPDEYETLVVNQQLLRTKLQTAGVSPSGTTTSLASSRMMEQLRDWHHRQYKDNGGKAPTDAQVEAKIDQLMLTTKSPSFWSFGMGTDYLYELSEDPEKLNQAITDLTNDEGTAEALDTVINSAFGSDADDVRDRIRTGDVQTQLDVLEAYEYFTKPTR